jgi:DNA-binding CsgD family transcriptional regulator
VIARWEREFGNHDPWHEHHVKHGAFRVGAVFHGAGVGATPAIRRTTVYQECFRFGGGYDKISVTIAGGAMPSFVGVYRRECDGFFEPEHVRRAHALAPHLVRAGEIARQLRVAGDLTTALAGAADESPHGVVVLDQRGLVGFTSDKAGQILSHGDGIAIRCSRLAAAAPAAHRSLSEAIHDAAVSPKLGSAPRATFVSIPRHSLARPYQLLVCPIPARSREESFGAWDPEAAVLVLISDPSAERRPDEEALRLLFGLTPALARLAAALAMGATLAEYAEARGITVGTARNQLKELFARTATSRQAELVRLLLSGIATLASRGGQRGSAG